MQPTYLWGNYTVVSQAVQRDLPSDGGLGVSSIMRGLAVGFAMLHPPYLRESVGWVE
jgi:hypothetical protein